MGDYMGEYYGSHEGDIKSLDYSSFVVPELCYPLVAFFLLMLLPCFESHLILQLDKGYYPIVSCTKL